MVSMCLNIIRAGLICLIWLFPAILIFLQNDITSLFMTFKDTDTDLEDKLTLCLFRSTAGLMNSPEIMGSWPEL